MKKGCLWLLFPLLLLSVPALSGQQVERVEAADLPRWIEKEIINFFNDPSTIHFSGRTRIPSTRVIVGDVAALGGPFIMAGELDGELVIVNGDLVFEEGGVVTGDVILVGGRVLGRDLGEVEGSLTVYEKPLRYVQRGDRIAAVGEEDEWDWNRTRFAWGEARFTIKAGQNYNRVEGLPVVFGPSIRTAGSNPLRLDLYGIFRTEVGTDLGEEDLGYDIRLEQALGGRDRIGLGARAYSYVDPVEDWGLTNLEASLATFLLHTDYRDYYERRGWSAFLRFDLPYLPVELRAEYVQEDHEFAPEGNPWSLTDDGEPWRPQILVAEGDVRFLEGSLTVDTRNDREDATDGWFLQARARQGLGGDLIQPEHRASPLEQASLMEPRDYDTEFTTGFLDVRSYNRVGPRSSLSLRGLVGGALRDSRLPPQYQHALGGEGSLPGYRPFYGDCGARETRRGYDVTREDVTVRDPVYTSYGCDQFALFQAELRGSFFFDLGGDDWDENGQEWEDWDWYPTIEWSPAWSAFFNAGRGWTGEGPGDTATLADVGVGLFLGDLGLYWAYPLNKDDNGDRKINFFIRLSRRF